jgi:threonine dehydratase
VASLQLLDAIGNTPLVELRRIVPAGSARVIAKLESANPTGSMKDRMARALIERAAWRRRKQSLRGFRPARTLPQRFASPNTSAPGPRCDHYR